MAAIACRSEGHGERRPTVTSGPRLDHAIGRLSRVRRVLVEMRTPVYQAVLGPVCSMLQEVRRRLSYTSEYPDRIVPLVGARRFLTHAAGGVDALRPLHQRRSLGRGPAAPLRPPDQFLPRRGRQVRPRPSARACRWASSTTTASPSSIAIGCSGISTPGSSPQRRPCSSATRSSIGSRRGQVDGRGDPRRARH